MKEKIVSHINTKTMGRSVHFFACTDSTNIQAKHLAESGAPHGTLLLADMQTAGKGRRGRQWDSPAGKNLYFSLLLKPDFAPDKASMLTLVMALAVEKGIRQTLQEISCDDLVQIKWPNDLCINGKKICGILTEMSLEQGYISHVIIGVGINVRKQEFAPELVDKATSIEAECGRMFGMADISLEETFREKMLGNIMLCFEQEYDKFCEDLDLVFMQEEYNARLVNRNREVCVLDPKGEFRGVAEGINESGELLVKLADGSITAVYAGEVSVRGIYGYT